MILTSGTKTLMQKLNIKKYLEIFDIKRVKIMNDIIGKKTIINLPEDFICYVGDDGAISFEKFEATFSEIEGYLVFSVCVDDFLWIDKNYKLTDNEEKKAFFGQIARGKNGNINYSSIHARVAAVYSALCEGKIKINELNRIED